MHYRIPPKQVAQANPVQMMLLDAVAQAAREAGAGADVGKPGVEWASSAVSRGGHRVGVSVGTVFGGEFSNQLQLGLRLPELQRTLARLLAERGLDSAMAEGLTRHVLKLRPALLDETGSFTASTLASRVAKTFDLMGGAAAIDAEDASSLAALTDAADRLRAGQCDTMICGTAQRALDLPALERMDLAGQLVRSGDPSDVPDDCSRVIPGEGVAVVILRRLSDAVADGQTVLGVLDDFTAGSGRPLDYGPRDAAVVRAVGYLPGSHSLIRVIADTADGQTGLDEQVAAQAADGVTLSVRLRGLSAVTAKSDPSGNGPLILSDESSTAELLAAGSQELPPPSIHATPAKSGRAKSGPTPPRGPALPGGVMNSPAPSLPKPSPPSLPRHTPSRSTCSMIRLQADSEAEFSDLLAKAAADPASVSRPSVFREEAQFRAALLEVDGQETAAQIAAVRKAWDAGRRAEVLDRYAAVLWQRVPGQDRMAWLFPGQGSQYAGRPDCSETDAGREALAEMNAALALAGQPKVNLDCDAGDIWSTQVWTLAVTRMLCRQLEQAGVRPDVVLGHSFGECAAAVTAGAMTLPQAVRLSRLRADAVATFARNAGGLLSVRGTPSEVAHAAAAAGFELTISHHNAPTQTVLSGRASDLESAKAALSAAGLASMAVPVAAAFHSPALAEAEASLQAQFGGERLRPPRLGYLSATAARFLAEPDDVRESLITQLTRPVQFAAAVARLAEAGVAVAVEVGPGRVLTKLARECDLPMLCVAGDDSSALPLLAAARECVGLAASLPAAASDTSSSTTLTSAASGGSSQNGSAASDTNANGTETAVPVFNVRNRVADAAAPHRSNGHSNGHAAAPYANRIAAVPSAPSHKSPEPVAPSSSSPSPAAEPSDAAPSVTQEQALAFLTDLIVDLTGYDPDVVDAEADLEADLGVDSIKKAQVIGELAAWSGLAKAPENLRLDDVRTLAQIAALVPTADDAAGPDHTPVPPATPPAAGSSDGEPLVLDARGDSPTGGSVTDASSAGAPLTASTVAVSESATAAPVDSGTAVLTTGRASEAAPQTVTAASLDALMIDFVVDQTGYDPDVIDVEADLEADLGVDSIKQAQLLGEMHAVFGLAAVVTPGRSLSDFRTLRSIREFLLGRLVEEGVAVEADEPAAGGTLAEQPITKQPVADEPVADTGLDGESSLDAAPPKSVHRDDAAADESGDRAAEPETGTLRFALSTVAAPQRPHMPSLPTLTGPALIVGNGPLAQAVAAVAKQCGQKAAILEVSSVERAEAAVTQLWESGLTPHLFLLTAQSDGAMRSLNAGRWADRRTPAIEVPYRVCQLWNERVIEAGLMDRATVVAVTSLGGAYGFDGRVVSPEGGGVGALVKAMLIENWMRGFRTTPMKVVDIAEGTDPVAAADAVFAELAVPSYDMEVAHDGKRRSAVQAEHLPLHDTDRPKRAITRGGAWVVSGGGRGITPLCAMALAERHDLSLHLLGTAPVPEVTDETRAAYAADRAALRRNLMRESAAAGENGIKAWRRLEKSVEIDATLSEARRRGIRATYYQCDVSDASEVADVLRRVRAADGPVRGVIHGAGAGQDARFDRKRPHKVDQCIRAKVDGCVALAEATKDDPLEWFVGFGSISGRFGANGHTDYSLANDMLAKCVTRLRRDRPDLATVTFHWHAWGDVGMATKPEAKLTLEMIDMEFMPAAEGVGHFLRELEHGGDQCEVLITDRNYYRKFFPADRISDDSLAGRLPLLDVRPDGQCESTLTLDPTRDRFLTEHRVRGVPTLPFVVALELMAEAALRRFDGDRHVVEMQNVEAMQALKFNGPDPLAVTLTASGNGPVVCSLTADVRRRDGRMVEEAREFFRGEMVLRGQPAARRTDVPDLSHLSWSDVPYLEAETDGQPAAVYHGPPLRTLRQLAADTDTDTDAAGRPVGWGRIAAPAAIELFDERRPGSGWSITAAVADGCLYAAAAHVYALHGRPSLPVSFDRIQLGRTPDPGEPCLVRVLETKAGKKGSRLSWTLTGLNGDVLMQADDFRVAFLGE